VESLLVYSTQTNTPDGWFRNEDDLVRAIRRSFKELNEQATTFSWHNQKQRTARDVTKESGSFLFFQLFKIVLKSMPKTPVAKESMISTCRHIYHGNTAELSNIDKFERTYKSSEAIQWYTKESFVYK